MIYYSTNDTFNGHLRALPGLAAVLQRSSMKTGRAVFLLAVDAFSYAQPTATNQQHQSTEAT